MSMALISQHISQTKGADLFWEFFSFFFGHFFFFWSVGFVPAFFPAHVVWLVVFLWWCGGVFVVVFVW